ncbi:hypothetical protein ACNQR7_02545 [Mycolicibacterium senegalense]|uniref:glycine-rich domain-containing protein n=1 Tax=Mycolicibacterium senegalense TaxID=1796 RepID=UPI003AAC6B22
MPWGSELPTRVRTHRAAWFDELTGLDRPPHREVWTGTMQANAATAIAVAEAFAPTASSSAFAKLPAGGDSFPHQFPWEFGDPSGTATAVAEVLLPQVGIGPNVAEPPTAAATADALAPEVRSGALVRLPDGAGGQFPWQFPHQFNPPTATVTAAAEAFVPQLLAGAVVEAAVAAATAGALAPSVVSGVAVTLVLCEAIAAAIEPAVSSGASASVPAADASAGALQPTVGAGASLTATTAEAEATAYAPNVAVSVVDFYVDAPTAQATAEVFDAELVAVVEVPVAEASAGNKAGFPHQFPYEFVEQSGVFIPQVSAGASVYPPAVTVTAEAYPPASVGAGAGVVPPTAAASGAAIAPTAKSDASAAIPTAAAIAAGIAPSVVWDQPPVLVAFTTVGSYTTVGSGFDISALRASGYTHIDRIVLGGGQGGAGGTFDSANGGNAGVFSWDTISLADYPSLTEFTGTVGDGGNGGGAGSDGNAGQASTSVGAGVPTLTGSGGPTGSSGGRNGDAVSSGNANSGKDVSLNGQTYVGGSTSTTTTAGVPGSGGRGGGSFSSGSKGGRGQVWYCARRVG